MRNLTFVFLLLAASCYSSAPQVKEETAAQTAVPGAARNASNRIRVQANGQPHAMRFQQGALAFCDASGGHLVNLKTGQPTADASLECKREAPNIGCLGASLDVEIRSSSSEPADIVEIDGESYPLKGRVHDCAVLEKAVGLATSSGVVLIDTAEASIRQADAQGADRVALTSDWIAWSNGSNISAAFRHTLKKLRR